MSERLRQGSAPGTVRENDGSVGLSWDDSDGKDFAQPFDAVAGNTRISPAASRTSSAPDGSSPSKCR